MTTHAERERARGWTAQAINAAYASQGGVCAICGLRGKRGLQADHNHETGAPRGLLCQRCVSMLGRFERSRSLTRQCAPWIRRYGDAGAAYLVRFATQVAP
jgi:hypothetical protein